MVELVKSLQAVPGGMLNVLLSTIAGTLPKAIYMAVQLISQLLEINGAGNVEILDLA